MILHCSSIFPNEVLWQQRRKVWMLRCLGGGWFCYEVWMEIDMLLYLNFFEEFAVDEFFPVPLKFRANEDEFKL